MNLLPQLPEGATTKATFASDVAARATKQLFLDENSADFHFVFNSNSSEPMKLPAHKIILSTVSPMFRAILNGPLKGKNELEILDASFQVFKEFLQFFYLADVTLTMQHITGVMYLGLKYQIKDCLDLCSLYLMQTLSASTVCWGYNLAVLFKRKDLMEVCNAIIQCDTSAVLQSNGFLKCDKKLFGEILKLVPSGSCPNTAVLKACMAWAKTACLKNGLDGNEPLNIRNQLGQLFYELPFDALSQDDFSNLVFSNIKYFKEDEIDELTQMVASTSFQPTKFVRKNSSDEQNTPEYTRIIRDSFVIKDIETTIFSSNKPLLLKGFACANVYSYRKWTLYSTIFPVSKITITKETRNGHLQKKESSANLFTGKIKLKTHGINQVDLPTPILIQPGIKYEICLQQTVRPSHRTFSTLKTLLCIKPDIEIRFHSGATGLVTALSVERLETMMNCDLVKK